MLHANAKQIHAIQYSNSLTYYAGIPSSFLAIVAHVLPAGFLGQHVTHTVSGNVTRVGLSPLTAIATHKKSSLPVTLPVYNGVYRIAEEASNSFCTGSPSCALSLAAPV